MTSPSVSESAIDVHDLVKRYPKATFNAVDGVSFSVRRGEIFGLLGPNGAGKTTTIGVLTTRVRPTSGTAHMLGIDVTRDPIGVKQHIAVVPQMSNLDQSLKVRDILTFHSAYHSVPRKERDARADALLTELGLAERAKDRVSRYSGGMNQRLMIARALMHSPDVLFLDEPTNNLDPQSRLFLWDRIRELNAKGLTILLTTHDMEEADRLCERIAIMDHGKILVNDTSAELKHLIPGGTTLEVRAFVPELATVGASGGAEQSPRLCLRRCGRCLASPKSMSFRRKRQPQHPRRVVGAAALVEAEVAHAVGVAARGAGGMVAAGVLAHRPANQASSPSASTPKMPAR